VEAYNRAVDATPDFPTGPEYWAARADTDAASDRMKDMDLLVLTTQPTSIAGVAALLAHVGLPELLDEGGSETLLSTFVHEDEDDETKQAALAFPLRLASTVRAMAGTATVRRIEPSEPDPIYAAIQVHRTKSIAPGPSHRRRRPQPAVLCARCGRYAGSGSATRRPP
jgi:hypothetical protein